ncbi:MAG: Mur ligase domain-containing protein [Candidatus Saccharibacteria bacterium]|nr:Mur ligase domain-containing protein [Candidatus Saccharibacteria bacterium]
MKIYISGISGTGMGPLALMAKDAGVTVYGSDLAEGPVNEGLKEAGIEFEIGEQDGTFLQEKIDEGVEWFVYTSALPDDHPELVMARRAGLKVTKRDKMIAFLVEKLKLKMVAVAGTHGKTTTSAMIVFAAFKLKIPISYIVGTTLGYSPSGFYAPGSEFFVYEADEYDRNFLEYHPWLSIITYVSHDHPDIYPTKDDYNDAFQQFYRQSRKVIRSGELNPDDFKLAGRVRREDATLAVEAICEMAPWVKREQVLEILNNFPGVRRRFERLADGIYTDYAHHPEEVKATVDVALDEARIRGKRGIVVVYQPHQNTRQHSVREGYREAFLGADKVYWLPTFLTRENPNLRVLKPEELISGLENAEIAEATTLDEELWQKMAEWRDAGYLVVLMTAGSADKWLRKRFGIL